MAGRFSLPTVGAADLLAAPPGTTDFTKLLSPPPGVGDSLDSMLSPPPSFPSAVPQRTGDSLIQTLRKAGFKGEGLRTAWAIAKRESGGRADAFNPDTSTGDQSYGLFQINMLGDLGPSRRKAYGLKRNEDLFDPLTNARVAYKMSKGGRDFGAWGIGPNAYRKMPALDFSGYEEAVSAPPKGQTRTASVTSVVEGSNVGARAVQIAATQLGKPYVFGSGPDTSSFDCSDLVQWAYKQLGIDIPRDTWGQQKVLPLKSWADLKPGDPLYRKSGGHVVIYAGNGKVISAPYTGAVVRYSSLSDYPPSKYEVRSIT